MIGTETTFVIGAGASCPYGLPTGKRLKELAIELRPNSPVFELLTRCSIDSMPLKAFLMDLDRHPTESIDAYLETRQDQPETMRIGKHVIAALLGRKLQENLNTDPEEGDWIGYVFRRMQEGAGTGDSFVLGNRVNFVTFNFDRIIEDRFKRDIERTHPRSAHSNFPLVVHVHGSLPPIPDDPIPPREWYSQNRIGNPWRIWLQAAAANINVVLDDIPESTLEAARRTILQASVVCFLGFAYGPGNLKRLFAQGQPPNRGAAQEYFGSAFGLQAGEQADVLSRFPANIKLGEGQDDCLQILRRNHILRP